MSSVVSSCLRSAAASGRGGDAESRLARAGDGRSCGFRSVGDESRPSPEVAFLFPPIVPNLPPGRARGRVNRESLSVLASERRRAGGDADREGARSDGVRAFLLPIVPRTFFRGGAGAVEESGTSVTGCDRRGDGLGDGDPDSVMSSRSAGGGGGGGGARSSSSDAVDETDAVRARGRAFRKPPILPRAFFCAGACGRRAGGLL